MNDCGFLRRYVENGAKLVNPCVIGESAGRSNNLSARANRLAEQKFDQPGGPWPHD